MGYLYHGTPADPTKHKATQGMAEEQFTEIRGVASAEALQGIDDILMDDDSVDYSPP